MASWLYRARQFFSALLGKVDKEDMEEARRVLGPYLYEVFAEVPGQYRRHLLTVYRRVRDAGCDDPHVQQAALLHDVGKYDPAGGRYVSLAYRVIIVLLELTPPGRRLLERLARWGSAAPGDAAHTGRLYPFYLSKHHAELGARRASEHHASEEVVRLITDHHNYDGQSYELLALQAADDRS